MKDFERKRHTGSRRANPTAEFLSHRRKRASGAMELSPVAARSQLLNLCREILIAAEADADAYLHFFCGPLSGLANTVFHDESQRLVDDYKRRHEPKDAEASDAAAPSARRANDTV